MRKPLRPGKRFAAEPRVVGKNSRAAEQTGSGKRGRESALVPRDVRAGREALETAVGGAATKVGRGTRERASAGSRDHVGDRGGLSGRGRQAEALAGGRSGECVAQRSGFGRWWRRERGSGRQAMRSRALER